MRMKRTLALLLAAVTLCGMLVFPASAVSKVSTFSDVTDLKLADAVETLRLLGIVGGTGGGSFEPYRTLSRAEFCKMAVEAMDKGDLVAGQMNRTIFHDVPSTHWARGYINVATQSSTSASGSDKDSTTTTTPGIMRGDPYGNFNPDTAITYAEAVTILMRILKFTDADVGLVWPDGYLSKAKSVGLTDGVNLSAGDTLNRGQAALLFQNLLYTKPKESKTEYLTELGCKITEDVIIMAVDATATDGSQHAVKTNSEGLYKNDRVPYSDDLVGRRAKVVLDEDSHILAVRPAEQGSQKVVGILSAAYDSFKAAGGEEIEIKPDAKVWVNGEEKKYKDTYQSLKPGTQAVMQYTSGGELEYIFLRDTVTTSQDTAMVSKNKPSGTNNPFSALAVGQTDYQIYKNGVPATVADFRQYDVATYDKNAKVMYVSDLRITGVYENVYPNRETPATITMLGAEFTVLPGAATDLSAFKVGQTVTLLLTYDGRVAGAVSTDTARSNTVGVVEKIAPDGTATVTPLVNLVGDAGTPIKFQGLTSYSGDRAAEMEGQVVTVSSGSVGRLSLSRLTANSSGVTSPLDMSNERIGTVSLAPNVKIYDKVGTSKMAEVKLEDITQNLVPKDQITYLHKDYAGRADIIVLEDATGNLYDYGFIQFFAAVSAPGMEAGQDAQIGVKSMKDPTAAKMLKCGVSVRNGAPGGVIAQSNGEKLAAYVELETISNVRSSDFNMDTKQLVLSNAIYPIANNVQCYNRTTQTWFELPAATGGTNPTDDYMAALNRARAFSDTVTVYVDKAPDEGGKVRLVVVE